MHLLPLAAFLLLPLAWLEAQKPPITWRIPEEPLLSLGSRDGLGPEVFGSVAGAVRLSSGIVIVADRKNLELRSFSPTGKPLRTSGRKGSGPGEFQSMDPIQRCAGDSVFVYDRALFRISVFSPDGVFIRTADVRKWSPNGLPPYDFWCNPAGILVFVQRSTEAPKGEGPFRQNMEITLVVRNDSVVSLGTFPSSERYVTGRQAFPRHLGKETTVGVGEHSVYVGTADSFYVAEFSLRGERVNTLRERRATIPVTSEGVSAYIKGHIASRGRRVSGTGYEEFLRELEWPKAYPAYGRLVVDGADNLWVQEFPIPGGEIRSWTIYAKSGAKIAVISLPKGLRLLEAGANYVLGVSQDEFDVDYVRVYALVK